MLRADNCLGGLTRGFLVRFLLNCCFTSSNFCLLRYLDFSYIFVVARVNMHANLRISDFIVIDIVYTLLVIDLQDLVSCSLVCRFLNFAAADESLWRRLLVLFSPILFSPTTIHTSHTPKKKGKIKSVSLVHPPQHGN